MNSLFRDAAAAIVWCALLVVSGCATQGNQAGTPDRVEVVARMEAPPGNIALAPDGRRFVSMHPFGNPDHCVREVLSDGTSRPFPNGPWGGKPGVDGVGLASVIGIECDVRGRLWMLDMGSEDLVPRLVVWDLASDQLERVIPIPAPVSVRGGFPQDLAIDLTHRRVYIADMGLTGIGGTTLPAIIIVDLETGSARRVLENHPALRSEPDALMVIDGKPVTALTQDGKPFAPSLGINPITIDHEDRWVYFGAMHGRSLYRVRAADLTDEALPQDVLATRVSRFGEKPVSDGITVDRAGNVYTTDVNHNAISVTDQSGRSRRLVRDDTLLSWPDGLSFGPDGMLYATVNQLHRHAPLNAGVHEAASPFFVVRVQPVSPGAQGR
jgi:sugar lactone lactonase YvrE